MKIMKSLRLAAQSYLAKIRNQNIKTWLKDNYFKNCSRDNPIKNFTGLADQVIYCLNSHFFQPILRDGCKGEKAIKFMSLNRMEMRQKMKSWPKENCLAHNINILSSLEEEFDGLQISLDFLTG
jgi:hypothetical protein